MPTEICPLCHNIFTVTKEKKIEFDNIKDATQLVDAIALTHGHTKREIRKKRKKYS